jgi:uncharacterized lipoprotein YmbA
MRKVTRAARFIAAALALLPVAPGCFGKTEVHYYTLAGGAVVGPAHRGAAQYSVHVAPAVVPEALDRPELVLRLSDTQLAVDDNHRWAEPLRAGIARAVAASLARELDGALVSASEQRTAQSPGDVELRIDVQRLEVSLTHGVVIDVAWTARWADDGPIRTGRSAVRRPAAPPGGYDAAIAACAAALDAVGSDVARSVRTEHLSRR